jgi:DNA-binding NarL/FixJ family response regulator
VSPERLRELAVESLRESSADSSALWQALLSGDWSLIDCFDAQGRRYLIAVRSSAENALDESERWLLARRARGVGLKVLALELGVSVPTISRRLDRAMKKLGVKNQTELARVLAVA